MNLEATLAITTPEDRDVVVTRSFAAPRDLVFQALTRPDLIRRWYAMEGWALTVCEVDLRVGGRWRYVMRKPDGGEVGQHGEYREIDAPGRLVHTEAWEDWDPGETLVTTVLTEQGGVTTFTSTMRFPSREVRDIVLRSGLEGNVGQIYGRLEGILAEELAGTGDASGPIATAAATDQASQLPPGVRTGTFDEPTDLVLVRELDAPVEAVWRAWTEADLVMRWWGPDHFSCPVARMDVRVGGVSLVCMRPPEGADMYSTWTYREVVPLERLEWIHDLTDEHGRQIDPAAAGLPDEFPRHVRNVLVMERLPGDRARLTVTEHGYRSMMFFDLSRMGLDQCLDKMATALAG